MRWRKASCWKDRAAPFLERTATTFSAPLNPLLLRLHTHTHTHTHKHTRTHTQAKQQRIQGIQSLTKRKPSIDMVTIHRKRGKKRKTDYQASAFHWYGDHTQKTKRTCPLYTRRVPWIAKWREGSTNRCGFRWRRIHALCRRSRGSFHGRKCSPRFLKGWVDFFQGLGGIFWI